jgi:hypothetical protein
MSRSMDGSILYVEVPPQMVYDRLCPVVAEETLAVVRAELGLPGLRLTWFERIDREEKEEDAWRHRRVLDSEDHQPYLDSEDDEPYSEGWRGFFLWETPDEIYVSRRLSKIEVILTVAHEARHAWQYRHQFHQPERSPNEKPREENRKAWRAREEDATEYAWAVLARLYGMDRLHAEAMAEHMEVLMEEEERRRHPPRAAHVGFRKKPNPQQGLLPF